MNLEQIRAKHPRLIYQSYETTKIGGGLVVRFHFLLEPDIHFDPTITIPIEGDVDTKTLEPFIFNLGMIETISYWKTACPAELVVEAGSLTSEQIAWWHDLFLYGLGEFFYKNDIDFTQPNFLNITGARVTRAGGPPLPGAAPFVGGSGGKPEAGPAPNSDLIMVGGGKDSAVTLELLKELPTFKNVFLLNPTPAALAVTKIAGFDNPIVVKRKIDPKLLELNKQGYLNGHTPFSAYLAFLSVLVGKMYGFSNIIASNEESASFGNVMFHGMEINHQYSKSFRFEKMFREYVKSPNYFSLLRPLNELQIASLFSKMTTYHTVFKSCNVGRGNYWCDTCPKCAFTYVVLSAFLPPSAMKQIFGSDFYEKPELAVHITDLVGLRGHKPFECVGTPQETKQALSLTIAQYDALPPILAELKKKLGIGGAVPLQTYWNDKHFLPKDYEKLLRD